MNNKIKPKFNVTFSFFQPIVGVHWWRYCYDDINDNEYSGKGYTLQLSLWIVALTISLFIPKEVVDFPVTKVYLHEINSWLSPFELKIYGIEVEKDDGGEFAYINNTNDLLEFISGLANPHLALAYFEGNFHILFLRIS